MSSSSPAAAAAAAPPIDMMTTLSELKEAHTHAAQMRRHLIKLYEPLTALPWFDYGETMRRVGTLERQLREAHTALDLGDYNETMRRLVHDSK
mgnify:CR=1 FL=1